MKGLLGERVPVVVEVGEPEWTCWTCRSAFFEPWPRHDEAAWERFFDSLPDYFWAGLRHRILGTLHIGSTSGVVEVGLWPWWVPSWWARRVVASLAARAGLGGEVYIKTVRNVMKY